MKVLIDVAAGHHVAEGVDQYSNVDTFRLALRQKPLFAYFVFSRGYDVVHLQFLQYKIFVESSKVLSFLKTTVFLLNLVILKVLGVKIVWTVHHMQSHESLWPGLDRFTRQVVIRLADHLIVLAPSIKRELQETYKISSPVSTIRLGNYHDFSRKRDAGEMADIDHFPDSGPVAIMCGKLRPYKRVPLGIAAADASSTVNQMLIAGSPASEQIQQDIRSAIAEARIPVSTHYGFVADRDLVRYVEESQVALILNDQSTAPATAHLAAACETPIVTVPGGEKEELVEDYQLGIIAESTSIEDIATALNKILERKYEFNWEMYKEDHSWDSYSQSHMAIYTEVFQRG